MSNPGKERKTTNTKPRRKLRLRIRGKLILAFTILAVIPLLALTAVVIDQTRSTLTSVVSSNLEDQVQGIASSMEASLSQLLSELHNLSVNPSIEQMAVLRPTSLVRDLGLDGKTTAEMEVIMDETRNLAANNRTQVFLETTVTESEWFDQLIVVNLDGMVLGATDRPERFIHLDETWYQAALEKGLYISDIQPLPEREEPGLVVAEVIYRASTLTGNSTPRPAGIVRGLVPLSVLTNRMLDTVGDLAQGELQLLSAGQVVFSIKEAEEGAVLQVYLDDSKPSPISLAHGETLGATSVGIEALTAQSEINIGGDEKLQDWEVRLAQPTSVALDLVARLAAIGYGGIVVTALAVLVVAVLVANNLAEPLVQLTHHAREVAEGKLSQYKPKRIRRDETGELTEAFNGMTSQLARLLHRVRTASDALATSSQEISASMEEMAAGAHNQTEDIQSGTRQIEEMNQGMLAIDGRANEALLLSKNAAEAALQGETQAASAVEGMEAIKASVDSLSRQTDQIVKILALIRDIAEQTNLLALNAAIEAARAGEQGRSFAVVAQEVGELAIRSQAATDEIDEALRRIQEETARSIASVDDGQKEVLEVRHALQEITRATRDTEVLVQEIASECLTQTARTKEAVALFESIGTITEQTAAGTEETAAAAQNLADLAQQLHDLVADFQSQN